MGKTTKEQEDEIVGAAELPYDHPKKKSILKEPPVVSKRDIKMKKVKETLTKINKDYGMVEAEKIIEAMCKKGVKEENSIEHVPEEDPQKHMMMVKQDIAEMRELVGNAMVELLLNENEYREYFQKMLKKWGVSSPGQLPDDKKKEFFNAVEKGWTKEKGD